VCGKKKKTKKKKKKIKKQKKKQKTKKKQPIIFMSGLDTGIRDGTFFGNADAIL
jgi:hypothetical protein